jgi:hypothetical protein
VGRPCVRLLLLLLRLWLRLGCRLQGTGLISWRQLFLLALSQLLHQSSQLGWVSAAATAAHVPRLLASGSHKQAWLHICHDIPLICWACLLLCLLPWRLRPQLGPRLLLRCRLLLRLARLLLWLALKLLRLLKCRLLLGLLQLLLRLR